LTKKSNIILSIIIVSFIISVCSIGVVQDNPSTQIKKQDDDIITELSVPKTSGYTVTQMWKWKNPFTGIQDAEQVEISKDGNYIVARWWNNPNATLFKKDSNATVWIYEGIGNIKDVAISGDGKYIVLCNGSHVICLNNSMETQKTALWTFDGGEDISFVDISYTGDYISFDNHSLVGGNSDVVLLDKNGQIEWVYNNVNQIYGLAISADGRYVIASDDDAHVHMFNTTDYDQGIPMWTYNAGNLGNYVAISDDGNYAVAADAGNTVDFFNTTDYDQGIPMWTYTTANIVADLAISSDGKNIVVCLDNNILYFNNSFSAVPKIPMWNYPDPVGDDFISADINADGKYVVGGAFGGASAYLLNNSVTNPKIAEWDSLGGITDIAISGWGDYFIVSDKAETLYLFHHERPPAHQPKYAVTERWNYTSAATVNVVAVSADGKYMVAGTDDDFGAEHELFFFNTSAHDGIPMWSFNSPSRINSLAISANGKYIVAGSGDIVYFFNSTVPETGNKQFMWREMGFNGFVSVDISADGKIIVMGEESANNGQLIVKNYLGVDILSYQIGHGDAIFLSVAISADGEYIAVGKTDLDGTSFDETVYFFNTTDYDDDIPMWSFDTAQDMDLMAISADGEYIVAGSSNGKIAYLFNSSLPALGNNKLPVWNFSMETGGVNSVDISADGKDIVLGLEDSNAGEDLGAVVLLNNSRPEFDPYEKYEEWLWIYETAGNVSSVAITADGEYIVAGTLYDPKFGADNENTVFLFNNADYTLNEEHEPEWSFNTYDNVKSVSISAWGNYIASGGESTSGETFLFYHARPIPPALRPYIAGDDDDDDDDEEVVVPFGNHYLLFAAIAIASLVIITKRKAVFSKK